MIPSKTSIKLLNTPDKTFQRIAFFGPMAAGKTWCANYLKDDHYYPFHLAGKLKAIAKELYGVVDKSDRSRKILQDLGMDLRKHDRDVWIKYLLRELKTWEYALVSVDDMRYINEANYFRENGFILIQVICDESVRQERIQKLYPDTDLTRQQHPSETEWKDIEPDFIVDATYPDADLQIEGILSNVTYRPRWEK